jgi:hypothetical protein
VSQSVSQRRAEIIRSSALKLRRWLWARSEWQKRAFRAGRGLSADRAFSDRKDAVGRRGREWPRQR